jgi:hypothetical protein
MEFEWLDCISLPGNPAKANEDSWAHAGGAAMVFDGATGLGEQLLPGPSDAAWLAQFGARRLSAHARDGAAPKDALRAALGDAEKSFLGLRRRAPKENYEIPFASMMFVTANKNGFEALWFGDCAALVARPGESVEVVGEAFARRSAETRSAAMLAAAKGLPPASAASRPEFLSALRTARNRVNIGRGTWLFAPDASAADHVASAALAAPAGTVLLLASDGFLALASDYACYDANGLVAAAQAKGLETLSVELRAVEESDPEGRRFARFKKSDDATALLLRLI